MEEACEYRTLGAAVGSQYICRMSLHPETMVIRGGTIRDPSTLKRKVEMAIEDGDGPVISVVCDNDRTGQSDGMSLEALCRASDVVHTKVQVTTVARLARAGFSLAGCRP